MLTTLDSAKNNDDVTCNSFDVTESDENVTSSMEIVKRVGTTKVGFDDGM